MKSQKPKIITFYSYKGGVGRSMALANVAWLLSLEEKIRVLVVDWDIEAPGIHRYFNVPDEKIERGLIDLFYDYKTLLMEEDPDVENEIINLDSYIINVNSNSKNNIFLLPAGRVDRKYPNKVNDFNWNDFYENWQGFGFIEYLKEQLKKKADFILVDSRTGLSDISGICTMQIPDIVVLFFTSNEQNLYGTKFVCESISTKSIQLPGRNEPPKLILIPSRIESYLEKVLVTDWEIHAKEFLKEYLPQNENFLYIRNMSIPYLAYYSFGEKIAVKNDPHDGISKSIEKLTKMIMEFCSRLDISTKTEAKILDAINIQDPVLRNQLFLETYSELSDEEKSSNLAKQLLRIALNEVKDLECEELKVETLNEIAFHVDLVDVNEFLSAVEEIKDENNKASILISITNKLLDVNAIGLLDIIKSFEDENLKVDLLIRFIDEEREYPKKDLIIEEIINLMTEIRDDSSKLRLLAKLLLSQSLPLRIILIEKTLSKLDVTKNSNLIFSYLRQIVSSLKSPVEKDLVADTLINLLQSGKPEIRKNLICILGEINSKNIVLPLIESLKDNDYAVRMSAAEALGTTFQYAPDKQQAWNNLHKLTTNENKDVRAAVASSIGFVFSQVPDKLQAWNDLYRLTNDESRNVRVVVASALGHAFSQVPDKQQAWNELIKLTHDRYFDVRSRAALALNSVLYHIPDKQQVCNDLVELITYEDFNVKVGALRALVSAFPYVLDKQKAWNSLITLTKDNDFDMRSNAISALGSVVSQIPDKQQAWNNLVNLTTYENFYINFEVLKKALISAFFYVPDKQQAWNDLIKLTNNEKLDLRLEAVSTLDSVFSQVPDKQKSWDDLIKLTNDVGWGVKSRVASILVSAFYHVPEKQQAWKDLIKLIADNDDSYVISRAFSALNSAFSQVPDKQQAWNDLIRLTNSQNDSDVRLKAVSTLIHAFPKVTNKQESWNDLIDLATDMDWNVSSIVSLTLDSAFYHMPNKQQAWNDLHKLITNGDSWVRSGAVDALGSAFSQLPNEEKQQAWEDLHRLTTDTDKLVRSIAADSLGSAFSNIPDKQQAWEDLIKLTTDEDSSVRAYANNSLGKISIFRASQAEKEDDYKKELERAITFFEKSAQESSEEWNNPSQFCLPFYRSFHTIIFKRQEVKTEVDKYLAEAKNAVRGSKSKELLFEAVESLANALKEIKNLENLNLETKKEELNFFGKYLDQAAKLMNDAEKSPVAAEMMRKGMPILDRNLRELLEEIQIKAKRVCENSKGTAVEEITCTVSKEVQKWEMGTAEEISSYTGDLLEYIKSNIPKFPENKHIFEKTKEMEGKKDLKTLLKSIPDLFEELPNVMVDPERMKPTIGIITALPKEYAAINILLENKNDKYWISSYGVSRKYCLGEISSEDGKKHNVVLVTVGVGNNNAETRASLIFDYFPNVKSIIMVGIAEGVPNLDKVNGHVRLGDIVVSNEQGIIQYDYIDNKIKNSPQPPSADLMEAVRYLEAEEILGNRPWEKHIDQALSQLKIERPSEDDDKLYCSKNQDEVIEHPKDKKRINGKPKVFIGNIASANILQKNPMARDELCEELKVKAIEMEASGIADATWNHEVGYLVVRGICDYCDSHKNDEWQQYAAVVAAAYTKALIESMP